MTTHVTKTAPVDIEDAVSTSANFKKQFFFTGNGYESIQLRYPFNQYIKFEFIDGQLIYRADRERMLEELGEDVTEAIFSHLAKLTMHHYLIIGDGGEDKINDKQGAIGQAFSLDGSGYYTYVDTLNSNGCQAIVGVPEFDDDGHVIKMTDVRVYTGIAQPIEKKASLTVDDTILNNYSLVKGCILFPLGEHAFITNAGLRIYRDIMNDHQDYIFYPMERFFTGNDKVYQQAFCKLHPELASLAAYMND